MKSLEAIDLRIVKLSQEFDTLIEVTRRKDAIVSKLADSNARAIYLCQIMEEIS